jgi:hypothetical protein
MPRAGLEPTTFLFGGHGANHYTNMAPSIHMEDIDPRAENHLKFNIIRIIIIKRRRTFLSAIRNNLKGRGKKTQHME